MKSKQFPIFVYLEAIKIKPHNKMKTLRIISRFVVGAVFIFSGFVKGIDPMGSTFKFMDYFTAFDLQFLEPAALPLAIILSTFEFVLGIALISNFKMRLTSWVSLIFMGFFTVLTFYLALKNPVSDCGCFGDAIKMTNWETFGKNVIIMALVIFIFIQRDRSENPMSFSIQYGIMGAGLLIILGFTYYSYNHLPIIDFRPYKEGTNIPEKMKIPEDAPQPKYETILKYKKDGKVKEFSLDNLPDSTWEWVATENILIEEGYQPSIHDFTINTLEGRDMTDIFLEKQVPTFVLISYDLNKFVASPVEEINQLAEYVLKHNENSFICLTASVETTIQRFKQITNAPYTFYNTDETTLKTIIRSNPGLMLIQDGTIIKKWHYNDIPTPEEVNQKYY
jgi:uncharacterized membrane protein YphA (DoxX/SURF4 family)